MARDNLSEKEKATMQEFLKKASMTEDEIRMLAEGVDDTGEFVNPVDTEGELTSAAALALEFVESMESPEAPTTEIEDGDAVEGFDALLKKLETLRSDISSLQRGVVGVFAAQLLSFRGKVVELRHRISDEMVERLRMQFFKTFIESTFVEIVDTEFASLEKELVDKIVEQTQERFKEFAGKIRDSSNELKQTIMQQQDIVRSFMSTLEEEAASQRQQLVDKDMEIRKLEMEIKKLQSELDTDIAKGTTREELVRKVEDLEQDIEELNEQIYRKDALLDQKNEEISTYKANVEEMQIRIGELQTQIEVYKAEQSVSQPAKSVPSAELEALEAKISLIENALSEKRAEAEQLSKQLKDAERRAEKAEKDKEHAESDAKKRLEELESVQDRIGEVQELEEKVYNLENELKDAVADLERAEIQKEAFEKATRLMEKERDMALEARDLANERASRYIKVLGMENNTKVLLLVDEVGSMTFASLGKSLGVPMGVAAKAARDLEKLGVLRIEDDTAYSTLEDTEIEEGEIEIK
ncbi:MAG: hypothetical protein GF411_15785 [Candidatus Lokiarchaeota archaeon]|nr:hypothetical protein [Candidatus Lokiarchaeota archaeon]